MDRKDAIRAIRDAADIVSLVAEKVKLRKSGAGWLGGPCPIHGGGSRTPCISVQPEKGEWHCFGCGEGGDAFDFLQKAHGMTFEEALGELSNRTGIALPKREQAQPDGPEIPILHALAMAQDFYSSKLWQNLEALSYLRGRGLSDKTITDEGIGYAPAGWETTTQFLASQGIASDISELAGISVRSQRGTLIDMMRDRITVPIKDQRGRVIAFGGRILPGAPPDSPKYLNTKETPLFNKGETVFHLHRARGAMREEGAVIVEGYFDVIALCQEGVQSAVAPLGTALTGAHLRQIQRWTNQITFAFDGDKAGWGATAKSIALALPAGFEIRLLTLPDGEDPDTWARANGAAAKGAITSAPDWATFAMDRAKAGKDLRRMEDRLAAAREVAKWIAYLPAHRQEEVRTQAAYDLKVSPNNLQPVTLPPKAEQRTLVQTGQPVDEAIQAMVSMATRRGAFLEWVQQIPRGWWDWRQGAVILETVLDADGETEALGPDSKQAIRAFGAQQTTGAPVDPKRLQIRLEREYLQRETQIVIKSIADNSSDEQVAEALQTQLTTLRARMARLARGIAQ